MIPHVLPLLITTIAYTTAPYTGHTRGANSDPGDTNISAPAGNPVVDHTSAGSNQAAANKSNDGDGDGDDDGNAGDADASRRRQRGQSTTRRRRAARRGKFF